MGSDELLSEIASMAERAQAAAAKLTQCDMVAKNRMLMAMADEVERRAPAIQAANNKDMEAGRESGLSSALLDRLQLTDKRIDGVISGIRHVITLEDPVGQEIESFTHNLGMKIARVRVPIGVIGIIYESRPNVTADAAVLCLKSGNAVILRGGKEAQHSNAALRDALVAGGQKAGMPDGAIQLIDTTDREAVKHLVSLDGKVNLIIPRGGEGLIRAVAEMSRVPVIKHYKGVCHVYVDESADLEMALNICENAKVQRPGVCNAMETLLVHRTIAPKFLPQFAEKMGAANCELRGDATACEIVATMKPADEADWDAEYLDLILAVKVVDDVEDAILHIANYGSQHSDAIVANDAAAARRFVSAVDSAAVYVNASTRFTDGSEFGMGAEIGISTDKLHARGPMGLRELTTYKFVVTGTGQVRP